MRKILKKAFKIFSIIIIVIIMALIVLFYRFSTPKTDKKIEDDFLKSNSSIYLNQHQYKDYKYRVLTTKKELDTTLPTVIFVHGSIGSLLDFKAYLKDEEINKNANLISYDRIGYGINQTGEVKESIAFESELLADLIKDIPSENIILVGYSYGGPIVLALKNKVKSIVLLAPAVYSKVEPMPWGLNLYKWKVTRILMPKIWQAASKEKLSHKNDLAQFENNWSSNKSNIISVHGKEDWIVPYSNSIFLQEKFTNKQFELVTLNEAGHGLVWSHFKEIKKVILQQINK
jgi:pimeloyl-ACP methyl ester carboxylesterase